MQERCQNAKRYYPGCREPSLQFILSARGRYLKENCHFLMMVIKLSPPLFYRLIAGLIEI
ncbi:MAG: hypothetical protein MUF15_13655 [Acidobacteria bacterium]|nr:hypothetical protein [Acidobacteriota bacterium]